MSYDVELVRCQVFVRQEMYPASWVEPWPPDWWIAEDGEPDEGEQHAHHIPAPLAERAQKALEEFRAAGEAIDHYMEGRR